MNLNSLSVWMLLFVVSTTTGLTSVVAADPLTGPATIRWKADDSNDLRFDISENEYSLETTGNDPFIRFEIPAVAETGRDWVLAMETFCVPGIKAMHLYTGERPTPKDLIHFPALDASEGWTTYRINLSRVAPAAIDHQKPTTVRLDFGMTSGVRLSVRKVQIRPATNQEVAKLGSERRIRLEKLALAETIDRYYHTDFPARIRSVEKLAGSIRVRGEFQPESDLENLYVIPRRQTDISAKPIVNVADVQRFAIKVTDNSFTVEIPASENSPLHYPGVRFQVVRIDAGMTEIVSAARYPDASTVGKSTAALTKVPTTLPPPGQRTIAKGLTCLDTRFTPDQLRDLGLRHGSINIVMNHLIRKEPAAGYEPTTIRDRRVYYNVDRTRRLDRNVQVLSQADLTVAGILLLPNREKSPPPIVHPDADPAGVYAMPNLKTREGADLYALTSEFLAKRYSGSGGNDLRIDHWIVHNEIDAGWNWTNMGEQPQSVYLDHYFRALRIVDAAARYHNPNATSFISLTHMWNRGEVKPWRWYPVKSIMESLFEHSRIEGDFPWGVAFHPYPEDLWQAATWNDSTVTNDFDTPTISIKNITVLDRFMHTEAARHQDGSVRTVILSEQGFHASEDDPAGLEIQAAALLYTFEQLRKCKSIIAFDYHRPVDHRGEGGLKLGLRGLSTRDEPIGPEKPGWQVFKAIGTDAETNLNQRYRHYWDKAAAD